MKIIIEADLFVYHLLMQIGGTNSPLFRKTFEMEINPSTLGQLLRERSVQVDAWKGKTVTCIMNSEYDSRTNTMGVNGNMPSATQEYVDHLEREGWLKNDKAFHQYSHSFPVSQDIQDQWDRELAQQDNLHRLLERIGDQTELELR